MLASWGSDMLICMCQKWFRFDTSSMKSVTAIPGGSRSKYTIPMMMTGDVSGGASLCRMRSSKQTCRKDKKCTGACNKMCKKGYHCRWSSTLRRYISLRPNLVAWDKTCFLLCGNHVNRILNYKLYSFINFVSNIELYPLRKINTSGFIHCIGLRA